MQLDTHQDSGTGDTPVKHLTRALECPKHSQKNYHIRQALQLLVSDEQ